MTTMNENVIVTISREYGSGGKAVAAQLSKILGIPCYDKEILAQMSKESGMDEALYEKIQDSVQNFDYYFQTKPTKFATASGILGELSLYEKMYQEQTKVIHELAKQSCIIVGRCSDYILKDNPYVVRVYISANKEDKMKRAVEEYGEASQDIQKTLADMDTRRANYYNYFSDQIWGKIANYDLVVNTSKVGVENAAEVIKKYIVGRITYG